MTCRTAALFVLASALLLEGAGTASSQEPAKAAGLKGARPKVAVLTSGAKSDLKTLADALAKTPGVKFKADEIKFADFGRDGGVFTSFFTLELTDRSKTDIGGVAKAVAVELSKKDRPVLFLVLRYRPDSIKTEQLRAALAKVKGVNTEQSWAGDSNLWVSVDNSGAAKLAEITRALHEARVPIRDPILDTDQP